MIWTKYEASTGRIVGHVEAVSEFYAAQSLKAGQALVEGFGDHGTEMVVGGAITPRDFDLLPLPMPSVVQVRALVDVERDRRIRAGITFADTRFQTRDEDMTNIMGAATAALAAITEGAQAGNLRWADPGTDFAWIAEDNSLVPMDAQTMMAFAQAVRSHKQAHIFAAKALKDSDPIPEDYAADGWWPA